MHDDEVVTDVAQVRALLFAQQPQWAELPLEPVESAGTDHWIYRLGDELSVRLPRIHWATEQVDKEQRWLPVLAPQLPLAIPLPLAVGEPGEGYPWRWSVYPWLPGENATLERLADPRQAALALAEFVTALQRIDTTGGPAPGAHNFHRGVPLAERDAMTRNAIEKSRGIADTDAVAAAWERALAAPAWTGDPVWIHGDLQPGNLLAVDGRIRGAIDFGGLGVGDPACDLLVAWNLLPPAAREVFREALEVDDATWTRGRGWAISTAIVGLPYYWETNPAFVRFAQHQLAEALADVER